MGRYYNRTLLRCEKLLHRDKGKRLKWYIWSLHDYKQSFFIVSCSISPNIREGLLEAFYGVYEKDPDKVILSMVFSLSIFYIHAALWDLSSYISICINLLVAGHSSYGSNGCACTNWRFDVSQKNGTVFSQQVIYSTLASLEWAYYWILVYCLFFCKSICESGVA